MKTKPTIGILDYRIGNLSNVQRAFEKTAIGLVKVVKQPEKISNLDILVIPGVGSFGDGMRELLKKEFINPIKEVSYNKNKLLIGICLGMQLLGESSEETPGIKGLGLLPFISKKIPTKPNFPVPHMGWDTVSCRKKDFFFNIPHSSDFYFAHSYYCVGVPSKLIMARTCYTVEIPVIIQKQNIIGIQFHPEKSQKNGLQLLLNILNKNR